MFLRNLSITLLLISCAWLANAQFRKDKLITPELALSYQWQPKSDFETIEDTWKYSTLHLDYRLPLATRMSRKGRAGTFGYKALLLNSSLHYSLPIINSLEQQHKLIDARLGLSFVLYGGGRNLLLGGGNANIFEDNYTIKNNIDIRGNGFLNWHFRVAEWFGTNIGVVYTYKFGRANILPLLGGNFNWDIFNLRVALPLLIEAGLVTSDITRVSLFLSPDGSVNNFYNDGYEFPGKPELIQFRQRKYKVGLTVDITGLRHVRLTPELGLMTGQFVAFSDQPITSGDSFFEEHVRSTLYVKMKLAIVFGEPAGWGKGHATNYLLDMNIKDVIKLSE